MENTQYVLSLDIGGANTKSSLLMLDVNKYLKECEKERLGRYKPLLSFAKNLYFSTDYFPFWQRDKNDFLNGLIGIKDTIDKIISAQNSKNSTYHVIITITAELSDAFYTKKEGINFIINNLKKVFSEEKIQIINVKGEFVSTNEALQDYLSVSASNWIATSLVFGEREKLGLLLDMGSTTLDLIPIKDGKPATIGKNDIDRLLNYELFYTGVLRPPIATIVQSVPFRNSKCNISFERFALMADVYLILGKITEEDYTCDTADDRGKSLEECYARLARMICGDINLVTKDELDNIAMYIYKNQQSLLKEAITRALDQFTRRFIIPTSKIRFNITGLGANTIIKPTLLEMRIKKNQIFYRGLTDKQHIVSTAICLGIIFLKNLLIENKIING